MLRKRRFKIYLSKWARQTYFQKNMAYGNFKDLPRGATSDKVLHDKTFAIAKIPKYDGY